MSEVVDYILQRGQQQQQQQQQQQDQQQQQSDASSSSQNGSSGVGGDESHLDTQTTGGSPENHRPYVPKYSLKDESLLRRVDLTSLESINATFFPDEYQKGKVHWVVVPKHILGIDTDFSFVAKKLEEYRHKLDRIERQRELARWDKMQRWERNMYEDRIAILMQQRTLLEGTPAGSSSVVGGVLTSRASITSTNNNNKRSREYVGVQMTVKPTSAAAAAVAGAAAAVPTEIFATAQTVSNYSEVPDSKRRCVRMKPPIPSRYQGDIDAQKDTPVPEFISLMNFPALALPDNLKCCVMCGQACPTSAAVKNKNKLAGGGRGGSKSNTEAAFIPTQNKGLCTACDVNVWVIASSGMEIKWCKGCKNFRCWAAFGDKGHATKCMRCRERQREKYAAQKEEKEKLTKEGFNMMRTPSNGSSKKGNN